MSSRRHREFEQMVYELYDLDPDERRRVLDDRYGPDDEQRQKIEAFLERQKESTIEILRKRPALRPCDDVEALERVLLPATGDRIANYQILRELGRGGMGAVYLAWDDTLGREVAMKWLLSANREVVRRFMDEARATARCRHENIVVIHEVREHAGHPFIVFEYLEGKTLRQWMEEQKKPLSLTQVLDIILPVVRALACAHEMGIVHRDLKPENIMITESGAGTRTVKVLDFGIAKILSDAYATTMSMGLSEPPLTQTEKGMILGTLPYMSPEQWGAATIDHRTDIWAVGILLHELVAGRHPLGPLELEKLQSVVANLDVPMPRLTTVEPELAVLVEIINECLMKRKHDRIQAASALYKRLERVGRVARRPTGGDTTSLRETITALLLNLDTPAAPTQVKQRARSSLEGFSILCVDDEDGSRNLLERLLGSDNHVTTARNAYEALERLRGQAFDIMITDENMPGPTGTQLAMQVGKQYPDLPVVLLTGYDDNPGVTESLTSPDFPVVDLIPKPYKTQELKERIFEACDATFGEVVQQTWPDYWATKPVLLGCRRIIRGFMQRFGAPDVFQTALRHKVKECVHSYARNVVAGEPGYRSAAALRVSLARIRQLMERVHVGESLGLVGYLESMKHDFADEWPHIGLNVDISSPFDTLDGLADIQTLLILSAIELVDNARDMLESQGQIRVQLRKLTCTRAVLLKVWSNSPAIPAEVAERIFDESVTTKGPGRGRGLAIVKAMVKRFGGEIRLVQHDGISFLVTIPLPDEMR
jgi:serine/threonine protein kinase/two-component sensor histidine kinase